MSDYDKNDKEIYEFTKEEFAKLQEANNNLSFYIARSKNKNIVVYEVKLDGDKLAEEPISGYWLDIDPAYQKANRKKGKTDDRSEFNLIENQMAYGVSATSNGDGTYDVKLVALPKGVKATLKMVDGKPGVYIEIDGEEVRIVSVFAKSVERTLLPPKCIHVDIYAINKDGKIVTQRLNP